MSASSPQVAVVHSAQTTFRTAWDDRQHIDLISEAVRSTLRGTGIRFDDIDFVIDSGSDFLDGRSISNCGFLGAMGAHHKEESRVEDDGLWALSYATDKIRSGSASVGLVIAYSKPSETDPRNYWCNLLEPFTQRPTGFDHIAANALYAQRYLLKAGLKPDDLSVVAERAWQAAGRNPNVEIAPGEQATYFSPEIVASPLRRSDLARPVDGAVAVLVATEEIARQVTAAPVRINGIGAAMDQHMFAARDGASLPACAAAARMAYARAGSGAMTFDIAEVSADSSVGELMVLEALGLAVEFRALDLYTSRGSTEINPSGGALPANPIMATGLARLHEATTRLTDPAPAAGARQPRTAVVHGTGGFGMQNHCVVTLEVAA